VPRERRRIELNRRHVLTHPLGASRDEEWVVVVVVVVCDGSVNEAIE